MKSEKVKEIVYEVLVEEGLVKTNISRASIVKIVGRYKYDKAVKNGLLNEVSESKNGESKWFSRDEFSKLLKEGKI